MQTILEWRLELFNSKAACPGDKSPEFAASDCLTAEALHFCLFTLTQSPSAANISSWVVFCAEPFGSSN